jgi:hypothetical protein
MSGPIIGRKRVDAATADGMSSAPTACRPTINSYQLEASQSDQIEAEVEKKRIILLANVLPDAAVQYI